MIKPIEQLLIEAYNKFYRKRGIPPTKFSIGIKFQREFYNNALNCGSFVEVISNGDSFRNIPITWTKNKRIECLPRKKLYT